ncbi:MAG: vWA domain-containing protein, partial [Lachnospiraceae bacterium]
VTDAQKAASWFLNHYPLFGGMAAAFKIIEDTNICQKNDIQIAAVDAEEGELYINPAVGLSEEEWRFVLAHEFLHVGLMHQKRSLGRDAYLWNVACDYVINGWLLEMQVGVMPDGCLYDAQFRGYSAEEIYDRILAEARRYSKLNTLRGYGKGDVLGGKNKVSGRPRGVSLDDFFRNALMAGLEYQLESGRGTIPAGMVQEIRALAMPPIRWDVKLAKWFEANIIPLEKHRSYAHPSRRQAATPDIPRPRYVWTEEERMAATFGVVIDTSGSMSAEMIGKALGSIASFAAAKDVPAVRVIYCDAEAYDAGYLATDEIAGRVKVVGRGGTRLQPAVDLLEKALDFPKEGPILIITDGWIEDNLTVRRKHAYLLPVGRFLPFRPKGEVFYFEESVGGSRQ